MHAIVAFVALSVSAPGPKDPAPFQGQVLHGVCVSTTSVGPGQLESTFVVAEPGTNPDFAKGQRFSARYRELGVPYISSDGTRLFLPKFKEGDRSYWVVTEGAKGALTAVYDASFLRENVLPRPEQLIHKLADAETTIRGVTIPDETATRELARVVGKGVQLKRASARGELAREESESKNEFVKEYLRWLTKSDKK